MKGYVWVLQTPYAAVTDKNGKYVIDNVPANVELRIVLWHEQAEFFGPGGPKGEPIKLRKGERIKDFNLVR